MQDKQLIKTIQQRLEPRNLRLLVAEHNIDFQYSITDKVKSLIDKSDVGLILLTQSGLNSHFVSEEIGYLVAMGKPIIRLVEKGLLSEYKGFLFGHDYIELDPAYPREAEVKLVKELLKLKQVVMNDRIAWGLAGVVLMLWYFSLPNDKR